MNKCNETILNISAPRKLWAASRQVRRVFFHKILNKNRNLCPSEHLENAVEGIRRASIVVDREFEILAHWHILTEVFKEWAECFRLWGLRRPEKV